MRSPVAPLSHLTSSVTSRPLLFTRSKPFLSSSGLMTCAHFTHHASLRRISFEAPLFSTLHSPLRSPACGSDTPGPSHLRRLHLPQLCAVQRLDHVQRGSVNLLDGGLYWDAEDSGTNLAGGKEDDRARALIRGLGDLSG